MNGVIDFESMITQSNPFPHAVKLYFKNESTRNELISNSFVHDLTSYYIEPPVIVIQCKKCKKFDHSTNNCNELVICFLCKSTKHKDGECNTPINKH